MFVPRPLWGKGTSEKGCGVVQRPVNHSKTVFDRKADNLTSAGLQETEPESQRAKLEQAKAKHSAETAASDNYLEQLHAGIELIFTDYAHQEKERAQWLKEHSRTVEGEDNFVHLSAILTHENISSLKPPATQPLLQRALRKLRSDYLEVSQNGNFVRRRPSTYPLPFVPEESFELGYDNGVSYWDARTIYVEPHRRDLFKTPAKVAHWLREHGGMREKWLPIQAVIPHYRGYRGSGFVVLSGNITHEDMWRKWRQYHLPDGWSIMTKVDYMERTRMNRRHSYDHYSGDDSSDPSDHPYSIYPDHYSPDYSDHCYSDGDHSADDHSADDHPEDHPEDHHPEDHHSEDHHSEDHHSEDRHSNTKSTENKPPVNIKKRGRTDDESEDELVSNVKRPRTPKPEPKSLPIRVHIKR